MYTAECTYRSGEPDLLFFFPTGGDRECDLRVSFTPKAFYPAERDIGADADFDADIACIEMRDCADADKPKNWHVLTGSALRAAKCFLNQHHSRPMWDQAFDETAEAFGVETYARAA
jgi:hypothetical protein